MDALEAFDRQTGYPFSWFFYEVHGNRVDHTAIRRVGEGLQQKKLGMMENDAAVIRRWMEHGYGF